MDNHICCMAGKYHKVFAEYNISLQISMGIGDSLSNDIESLSVVVIGSIWLHLFQLLLPGNGVKSPQ